MALVKHKLKRSKELNTKFGTLQLMINIASIAFLFGFTWIFGVLTVLNANQAFQILFKLANSFLGFFIFIFFCVLSSKVRSWARQLLSKQPAPKMSSTSSASKQNYCHTCKSGPSDSAFTEDVPSLGSSAKFTCTISQQKHDVDEAMELKINCERRSEESETATSSFAEQTEELAGMPAVRLVRTLTKNKSNMEEVVEIRFDETDKGGVDTSKDLCCSNKQEL